MWRTGRASLEEITERWSIVDLWTANMVLDLEEDAEAEAENAMPDPKNRK